jgi:hypothetical protein
VATCFFLDTANNVLEYVETIHEILKPGGVWINLGPLLYHYADAKAELSIEPPYDLLKDCIVKFGFEFEVEYFHRVIFRRRIKIFILSISIALSFYLMLLSNSSFT